MFTVTNNDAPRYDPLNMVAFNIDHPGCIPLTARTSSNLFGSKVTLKLVSLNAKMVVFAYGIIQAGSNPSAPVVAFSEFK
jgi:hypothetical protein